MGAPLDNLETRHSYAADELRANTNLRATHISSLIELEYRINDAATRDPSIFENTTSLMFIHKP